MGKPFKAACSRKVDATGRSTGQLKGSRKPKIPGQFAWRTIEMLASPAYRTLSLSGHRVLARIEIELAHHGGIDNGKLPVTFDNFQAFGIDRHAVAPAIREVVALGFVEITDRGQAGNAEWRRPSLYRLTYRQTGDNNQYNPTDEWARIKTVEEAQKRSAAARRPLPKTKSQWGKKPVPVGETPTENPKSPVGEPPTTPVGKTPTTLDISMGSSEEASSGSPSAPPPWLVVGAA